MYNYAQIDLETNKVIVISQLSGEINEPHMIPINELDDRLLMCRYINGKFEGYYTKLKYENQKVIAEVYNYLNEFQDEYNDVIVFEYEGEQITVQANNGVAEIDFQAEEGLECTVKTVVPMFRNGEVTFNV